jgi:hypothetical protein
MKKLPVIIAAACTLAAVPALAQTSSQPPIGMNRDLGGMKGGGSFGERRSYGEYEPHRHAERGWRGMQEGCKYITVRQRQGDEIIVRHFKRCD